MVRVSIILTVFNASKCLEQCMDSIVSQTFKDMEIICVDDGSSDESLRILKKYRDDDDRITLISQKNSGAGAARNIGLRIARGEYLSFLDSDDFFEPDMIKKAYDCCKNNNSDFCVFRSDSYMESEDSFVKTPWTIRKGMLPSKKVFAARDVEGDVFKLFVGWAWDKLYSSRFIKENKILFQEIRTSNDMFFVFSALMKAERISVINDTLAHHRRGEGTLATTRELSWKCFHEALTALKKRLYEWEVFDAVERDFANYCLHASLWNINSLSGEVREMLFHKLKDEWFDEFGISSSGISYFYNEDEYRQYEQIMELDYTTWVQAKELVE